VLRSWLQAIQAGNEDAAWALMTEDARAEVGREQFDELMASALPEGLGAFADPTVDIEIVEVETFEGDGIVAIMTGSLEQEGTTAFRTEAVPLGIEVGTPLVDETFVEPEVTTVWTSSSLDARAFLAGRELPIEGIPSDIERVYLSIDGAPALRAQFDSSKDTAVATLDRTLDAGLHIATIVMIDGDRRILSDARPFEAPSP